MRASDKSGLIKDGVLQKFVSIYLALGQNALLPGEYEVKLVPMCLIWSMQTFRTAILQDLTVLLKTFFRL